MFLRGAECKFKKRTSKFKMADPMWPIKNLNKVCFLFFDPLY